MVQKIIQATELTLSDVKEKFNLQLNEDEQFFREWQDNLPEISDSETQTLEQVKAEFLYLDEYPMLEDIVKMVLLSPLLKLAGFYRPPFRPVAEKQVEISAEDDGEIVRGEIDVLVLQKQLWIVVIESKRTRFSLKNATAQALFYMMASPSVENPTFGLVTNGSHFRFIKLTKQDTPQYALSDEFTLYRRGNELYSVLSILKRLGELVVR